LEGRGYDPDSLVIKALSQEVVATIRELVRVNTLFKEHFNFYTQKIDIVDPFKVKRMILNSKSCLNMARKWCGATPSSRSTSTSTRRRSTSSTPSRCE
jgi:nucleoside diphosphate kinase